MTEQEKHDLAEWIAENVLGWKKVNARCWKVGERFHINCDEHIGEELYTPAGFFAVWDKVEEKGFYLKMQPALPHYPYFLGHLYEKDKKAFGSDPMIQEGIGKDRYEAFYKAVKEAWEPCKPAKKGDHYDNY